MNVIVIIVMNRRIQCIFYVLLLTLTELLSTFLRGRCFQNEPTVHRRCVTALHDSSDS